MMKRIMLILFLLLVMLMLAGCSTSGSTADKTKTGVVVGFSQLGSESSWRICNTRSMRESAAAFGYQLIDEDANQLQSKQIAALRSFIAYQVDYIVFSPIIETGWDNVLAEAKSAKIPVIIVDRMVNVEDESLYTAYVGADFEREGIMAGEFLVQKAEREGSTSLNIVEITGNVDSTPMRCRQSGFQSVIEGDSRFTVLERMPGDFLRSKGEECMRTLLEKYPGAIDVVYTHNDSMALGALDAIDAAGLVPGKDIWVITIDGEQDAIDQLKAGRINCVVECTPYLGDDVMEIIRAMQENREYSRVTRPEETCFTEYDDLTAIADRGY